MKGILLAGGNGTRLHPLTLAVNKVLLPIYDKPMVYYPLSVLMQAGIRDILIISTPKDLPNFRKLLGEGADFGVRFTYAEEPQPKGSAEVFNIGREFIGNDSVTVIYGDNIIYGEGLAASLKDAAAKTDCATVFGFPVEDPRRFGVIQFDKNNKVISIEEKPIAPKSNYAVVGLYCYDNRALEFVKEVKPSERGELEITDIIKMYLKAGDLEAKALSKDFVWLDTGTPESLAKANDFVRATQNEKNCKIAALEEIAYRNGWITKDKLQETAQKYSKSAYGQHLLKIADSDELF